MERVDNTCGIITTILIREISSIFLKVETKVVVHPILLREFLLWSQKVLDLEEWGKDGGHHREMGPEEAQ